MEFVLLTTKSLFQIKTRTLCEKNASKSSVRLLFFRISRFLRKKNKDDDNKIFPFNTEEIRPSKAVLY